MSRGVGAAFIAALALLAAAPAGASTNAEYGIQDDAWLLYGPGTLPDRLTTLENLGVGVVRFTLRWDAVSPTKPSNGRDPNDAAYKWGAYGDVLDALHARGMHALVTLYGSPAGPTAVRPRTVSPKAGFATSRTRRRKRFPWVRMWTAWNEPNSRTLLRPGIADDYTSTA